MSKSTEMRKNAHGMVKHAIHELDGPQGSVPDYRAVRAFLHLVDGYLELATSYELLEEMERGVYPPMGEILSGDDFLALCLEDATIAADVYDEVLARLAEVEAERDRALRRTPAERTANEAIRVLEEERDGAIAGQVMLDDKLTLMEHRAIDAEARLAEVEGALRTYDERTEDLIADVLADHWPMLGEADAEGHVVCTCGWQADVRPHNAHTVAVGHIMVEFVRARAVLDRGEQG